MITKIELDGFKTFKDFELELGPLQVIVGANGAGKSNLFDALRLLSRLARVGRGRTLQQDMAGQRGETDSLFTLLPDGQSVESMHLAVEMLVPDEVEDWYGSGEVSCRRLRYELTITRDEVGNGVDDTNTITSEWLKPILPDSDSWAKKYGLSFTIPTDAPSSFISTETKEGNIKFKLHQDKDYHGVEHSYLAEKEARSVLGSVNKAEYAHVLAAQKEMEMWGFLDLNPVDLRLSTSMRNLLRVYDNSLDLPSILGRLYNEDPFFLTDVSRDLANLVPGMVSVEVTRDSARQEYIIRVKTQDGRLLSWQMLSDGTLRMLALATLKNDPDFHGVLCLEEPENGVHPSRLKNLARLLTDLATDFSDPEEVNRPLRQLLVATHSPILASQPELVKSLLFAYMPTHIEGGKKLPPLQVTRITPVKPYADIQKNSTEDKEAYYTIDQIKRYLNSDQLDEARAILEKSEA